jgi:hypothetical protein
MSNHILMTDVSASKNDQGILANDIMSRDCHWNGCKDLVGSNPMKLSKFLGHIDTHLIPEQLTIVVQPPSTHRTPT